MAGNEIVGEEGGGGVRVAGGVGEEGLRIEVRCAHEHHESVRKLLG